LGDGAMRYALRGQKFARSVGITPRFPLLDWELLCFCATIPPRHWLRWGIQKYALRRAFAGELPPVVRNRWKKTGFPFDTAAFLRLRRQDWLRALDGVAGAEFGMADLAPQYEALLVRDPQLLWRLLNYLLWVKMAPRSAGS
jgi:asparagine synthetase B (glutamine-hydrolysing)